MLTRLRFAVFLCLLLCAPRVVRANPQDGVILFDQSTDTIAIAGQTILANTATYEARVLFTSAFAGAGGIFNETQSGAEDKHLYVGPSYVNGYGYPVNGRGLTARTSLAPEAWHHIAYVYDGSEERLYLDGNRIASRAATGNIANSDGPPFLGAVFRDSSITSGIVGYLDTFRVSDVARYSGLSFTPPLGDLSSDSNTLLLYNFNEAPGSSTVTDLSGNGHTGTLGSGFIGATAPLFVTAPPLPLWTPTGSMSVARRDHTATLLTSGKVLIVGWTTTQAELYDPATGSFSQTGATNYNHGQSSSATRLPDGRVLIIGGTWAEKIVEIYDPATGSFTVTGNPQGARVAHTATLLPNGKVLIAGGQNGGSSVNTQPAELYDPGAGTFQPTGNLITPRSGPTATLLSDGRVLVTGGVQITAPGIGTQLKSTEVYDPATGSFSAGPSMLIPRVGHLATLLGNGKVLILGGTPTSLSPSELFDPLANSLTPTGRTTVPRNAATATLLSNGKVLVAGGSVAIGPITTNSAELYDPATGTFGATATMAVARQEHTGTLLPNGRVLVTGGYDPTTGELASAELYSSGSNTDVGFNVPVEVDVTLPNGGETTVSLTFDNVGTPGDTSVSTSSTGAPPDSGFKLGTPPVYYDITTTATFSGYVRVCLSWTEGQFANESHIRLFHRVGDPPAWVDITDDSSRDTANNTLCGMTTSLSPFAFMEVKYPFAGFFQPVDNPPAVNAVKAGSAVPVKFSLGGDLGSDIFAPGYPRAELVRCETGSATDDIEVTVTAGGSTLNYDALTGQYNYVWKTEQAWAGSCRVLQVKFTDGEQYSAKFLLRK